ncbi:MAG: toxin-antitoxin system HicB family antitoxin [Armatimonadetes bacterium]|nr:toxin-antitoxin system HicB family antitoxin [Armatimonadota bacterium]
MLERKRYKSMNLRMPAGLHDRAKRMAASRNVSLTKYVLNAVEQETKREQRARLAAGFARLAKDPDHASVDYAFDAQAEVVLGNDS